jgi:amino acid transporter
MISVALATAWYALITFGVGMAMSKAEIEFSDANGLATLDAAIKVYGKGITLVIIAGGLCGILTSWIGFFIGGARAISAMARAKMLPEFLGKIHPVYKTPSNAVLLIGVLTALTPLLGRKVGVWLIDAGSAGIVFSWFFVCYAFIKLRKFEPDLERPYKAPMGSVMGYLGLVACGVMVLIFMPTMPSALVWPYEWGLIGVWAILGVIFAFWAKSSYGNVTREWRYEQIFGEKPKKLY